MNNVYRVVWNAAIGAWVVASELAKGRGRRITAERRGVGFVVAPLVLALGIGLAATPALAIDYTSVVGGPHAFLDGDTVTISDGSIAPNPGFDPNPAVVAMYASEITSVGALTITIRYPGSLWSDGILVRNDAKFTSTGHVTLNGLIESDNPGPGSGETSTAISANGRGGGAAAVNLVDVTSAGFSQGLFASDGASITSTGVATIHAFNPTLTNNVVRGVWADGSGSTITLNNADVTTSGYFNAYGLHASGGGEITVTGESTLSSVGYDSATEGAYIRADAAHGAIAEGAGSIITLADVEVTTPDRAAHGLYAFNGGMVSSSGMFTFEGAGDGSQGAFADRAGSNVSLVDAEITTTGNAGDGLKAQLGGVIESTGTLTISTSGDEAAGIAQSGALSQVTFAAASTSLSTTGTASHGLLLEDGATRTFDGSAGNALPTITVSGTDAAALAASGIGSQLTLTGNAALGTPVATGAESWGAKSELGGEVIFAGNSSTGGVGLWADDGRLVLRETADAAGSRVRIDGTNGLGLLLVERTSAALGSVEGDGTLQFQNPGGTLTLGSVNTAGGGSLVDGADYAGALRNVGTLGKLGTTTQMLSGTANTVGAVTVSGGTLAFSQNGAFTVTGDYTTGAGAQTTLSPSTATLAVGGAFTQAAGATLDVTVGDAPNVVARTAQLGGRLLINGVGDTGGTGSASEVLASDGTVYTLIQTTEGISGDFEGTGSDYVLSARGLSADGLAYQVGDVRLAWVEGGAMQGTGHFTVEDGMTFDIDVALADQTVPTGGFASGWDGRSLTKAGTGTLVVSAVQDYTGTTTLEAGTLQTNAANVLVNTSAVTIDGGVLALNGQDQRLRQFSGSGGQVTLDGALLTTDIGSDTAFAGDIVDGRAAGQLTKTGSGTLTLGGLTEWTGGTDLVSGTLVLDGSAGGAQLAGPVAGAAGALLSLRNGAQLTGTADVVDVTLAGSTWQLTGDATIGALTLGDGTVDFDHSDATFKTLTVDSFSGNGGVVAMNAQLDGDDASSDLLHVLGDASGTASLLVRNAGGAGAQTEADGIRLVQVDGASDATFSLEGRAVSGAYEYFLHRGGVADPNDGDWYLRSELASVGGGAVLRPEVGAYLANQSAAVDLFRQDRHDRPGEADLAGRLQDGHVFSMWLRANSHGSSDVVLDNQLHTDTDTSLLQVGADLASWGGVLVGVMAATGRAETDVRSELTGITARGRVEGEALGVYGTWYAQPGTLDGLYVDAWVQAARYRHRVAGEDLLPEKFEADATLGSVEAGYAWLLRESASHALYLEPQVQVAYTDYSADPHTEANGTQVAVGEAGGLGTRVGLRAYGHAVHAGNQVQPYLQADWLHAHGDADAVSFDGLHQVGGLPKERYALKGGLRMQLGAGWTGWSEFGVQRGDGEFRDTGGQIGLRRSW